MRRPLFEFSLAGLYSLLKGPDLLSQSFLACVYLTLHSANVVLDVILYCPYFRLNGILEIRLEIIYFVFQFDKISDTFLEFFVYNGP
jgi:hypothetical protein